MADISYTGAIITISASKTTGNLPIPLLAIPKDTDPFDIGDIDVGDAEIGNNGDMIYWQTANPVDITLALIPATPEHELLALILQLNRVEKGRLSVKDKITMTRTLPNGEVVVLSQGRILSGSVAPALTSSGRLKTPTYKFRFAKVVRTPAVIELANQVAG